MGQLKPAAAEVQSLLTDKESLIKQVGALERRAQEAEALEKKAQDAKDAEMLALERAQKASDEADRLRQEIAAEREASVALREQLEDAEGLARSTAEVYRVAVLEFGGETSALPSDPGACSHLSWLKSHVEKLSAFVGGAVDLRPCWGVDLCAASCLRRLHAH